MSMDNLLRAICEKQNPTVAGLDPKLDYVPQYIKDKAFNKYGETLKGAAKAILEFNKCLIDALHEVVPAIKPQAAYYEMYGTAGMKTLYKTQEYARSRGMYVITDGKRNDIGTTMEAYAAAHLGKVKVGNEEYEPFMGDALTVNGYLGSDGINPLIKVCKENDKGIFVLVKTSNPSSGEFQDRLIDGRPLFEYVAEKVNEWGSDYVGECGYSYVGAVVGATYPEQARITRKLMPKAYILVPGYGAQGATAKDLLPNFDENGLGAIVNSSRGIIAAYKQEKYAKFGAEHFADASRAAVIDMQKDIASVL